MTTSMFQTNIPPVTKNLHGGFNLNISADAIVLAFFIFWTIWKRAIKPSFAEQLGSFFLPIEEERRLDTILAQIGVITSASRVVLCAFHNGALDSDGYHLQKVSVINTYTSEGELPMATSIKNMPIARITYEIEEMLRAADWHEIRYHEDLPGECKAHMARNRMACMHNRLIKVGNLPIGILSLQYTRNYGPSHKEHIINKLAYQGLLEDLYGQIVGIMRRRIVNPGPVKRVMSQVIGMVKV